LARPLDDLITQDRWPRVDFDYEIDVHVVKVRFGHIDQLNRAVVAVCGSEARLKRGDEQDRSMGEDAGAISDADPVAGGRTVQQRTFGGVDQAVADGDRLGIEGRVECPEEPARHLRLPIFRGESG